MWPKLLKASAIEAMAERGKEKSSAALDAAAIRTAFADAERAHDSSKDVNHRLDVIMRETDKALVLDTRDREQGGTPIHRSYVMKSTSRIEGDLRQPVGLKCSTITARVKRQFRKSSRSATTQPAPLTPCDSCRR